MSHIAPSLGRLRLANHDDGPLILELLNESVSKTFRVTCLNDIIYLIDNAILSICQMDWTGAIVGFISARDYPLIPSVHPSTWESFIWTKYKATEMKARNTLFLHMMCWNPLYGKTVVDNMLKSIFMHDPYIMHIAMLKSMIEYPLLVPGQSRAEASFRRIQILERGLNGDRLPVLLIADRKEVSPRLRVRRAVEEDNDDLVPIIENHSARLQELYGEFYISELISRHPESDRVLLVCEHKELAVGIMVLNTTVNYEALEESYVLSPFAGLRHLNVEPLLPENYLAKVSSTSIYADANAALLSTTAETKWTNADANDVEDEQEDENERLKSEDLEYLAVFVSPSNNIMDILLEDEDDEPDYDIVNINTELLRIPEFLFTGLSRTAEAIQEIMEGQTPTEHKVKKQTTIKKTVPVTPTGKQVEPVRYKGTPNAFLLEIFAMHPDYDERYGFDMLEASYELFPNRDNCIICLPSHQPPFPLLEHFTPVTPATGRNRFINESLYVAHVNSVRGNMNLRYGEHYDLSALENILMNAPLQATLMNLYQSTLDSKSLESFVMLSENQPIGMIVVGPLQDGTSVRTQYDLEPEPRRCGTDGAILAGIMSPVLEPHTRWFLRELMRQSRYSTLFWICGLFAKGDAYPSRNLMSFASHMNPVHPRKVVPNISGSKELDDIYKNVTCPYALWMLEKPLTSLPKVYVNNSIVVVGASLTGLAFLESLLMGPASHYLTFSNLTLVSENGLPTVPDCLKAADICVPRDGRFTDRYLKSIPFYFYVDVMSATMVGIDRKRKCIHLKGGTIKYYDNLVLTCGQQFQHPEYLKDALKLAKEVQKGKPCDRILMDNPKYQEDRVPPPPDLPSNVFLINSLFEANINLRKLMRMISDITEINRALSTTNQVVVYGDCLEAYCCLASLMELGIQSKLIVFVEPVPTADDPAELRGNCYNDETVDERVQAKLDQLGIRVIRECHLEGWQMAGNHVESLDLMTPLHAISLRCFALFYFGLQAINLHAFKAINECGLVYDGGLVVSPTFETNDPNIYGAGTCVSYSRKLYATSRFHRNFCSENIGEALARLFLRRLDPYMMHQALFKPVPSDMLSTCSSGALGFHSSTSIGSSSRLRMETANTYRRWQPVMKFDSPIVKYAAIPGPLYYMKVRKPGSEIPMGVQKVLPHQGHTLVTDKNGNYFYLRLNALHVVEAITCLSNEPFSSEILSQLFGKHEDVFNKLLIRYIRNEIDDMYAFFTQPWMSALYQETFQDLLDDVHSQDIGLGSQLMKSKFALFDDQSQRTSLELSEGIKSTSHSQAPVESRVSREIRRLGTFRSVLEKYMIRQNITDGPEVDIPSECGQDAFRRNEALKFWDGLKGERVVAAHVGTYLDRNSVTNPQYAKPRLP